MSSDYEYYSSLQHVHLFKDISKKVLTKALVTKKKNNLDSLQFIKLFDEYGLGQYRTLNNMKMKFPCRTWSMTQQTAVTINIGGSYVRLENNPEAQRKLMEAAGLSNCTYISGVAGIARNEISFYVEMSKDHYTYYYTGIPSSIFRNNEQRIEGYGDFDYATMTYKKWVFVEDASQPSGLRWSLETFKISEPYRIPNTKMKQSLYTDKATGLQYDIVTPIDTLVCQSLITPEKKYLNLEEYRYEPSERKWHTYEDSEYEITRPAFHLDVVEHDDIWGETYKEYHLREFTLEGVADRILRRMGNVVTIYYKNTQGYTKLTEYMDSDLVRCVFVRENTKVVPILTLMYNNIWIDKSQSGMHPNEWRETIIRNYDDQVKSGHLDGVLMTEAGLPQNSYNIAKKYCKTLGINIDTVLKNLKQQLDTQDLKNVKRHCFLSVLFDPYYVKNNDKGMLTEALPCVSKLFYYLCKYYATRYGQQSVVSIDLYYGLAPNNSANYQDMYAECYRRYSQPYEIAGKVTSKSITEGTKFFDAIGLGAFGVYALNTKLDIEGPEYHYGNTHPIYEKRVVGQRCVEWDDVLDGLLRFCSRYENITKNFVVGEHKLKAGQYFHYTIDTGIIRPMSRSPGMSFVYSVIYQETEDIAIKYKVTIAGSVAVRTDEHTDAVSCGTNPYPLIPLDLNFIKNHSNLIAAAQNYGNTMHITVMAQQKVEIKWYQQSWFAGLLGIVGAVLGCVLMCCGNPLGFIMQSFTDIFTGTITLTALLCVTGTVLAIAGFVGSALGQDWGMWLSAIGAVLNIATIVQNLVTNFANIGFLELCKAITGIALKSMTTVTNIASSNLQSKISGLNTEQEAFNASIKEASKQFDKVNKDNKALSVSDVAELNRVTTGYNATDYVDFMMTPSAMVDIVLNSADVSNNLELQRM